MNNPLCRCFNPHLQSSSIDDPVLAPSHVNVLAADAPVDGGGGVATHVHSQGCQTALVGLNSGLLGLK